MPTRMFITTLFCAAFAGCASDADSSAVATDHPASPDARQAGWNGADDKRLVIADPLANAKAPVKAVPYPLTTCLVGDEELGTMGKPVSFVHEGREIKLCCKACEPQFRKDPQTFMKKLDEAAKKLPAKPAKPAGHEHH